MAPLHVRRQIGHLAKGAITLKVNGQTKQDANLPMIWGVAEQIS